MLSIYALYSTCKKTPQPLYALTQSIWLLLHKMATNSIEIGCRRRWSPPMCKGELPVTSLLSQQLTKQIGISSQRLMKQVQSRQTCSCPWQGVGTSWSLNVPSSPICDSVSLWYLQEIACLTPHRSFVSNAGNNPAPQGSFRLPSWAIFTHSFFIKMFFSLINFCPILLSHFEFPLYFILKANYFRSKSSKIYLFKFKSSSGSFWETHYKEEDENDLLQNITDLRYSPSWSHWISLWSWWAPLDTTVSHSSCCGLPPKSSCLVCHYHSNF